MVIVAKHLVPKGYCGIAFFPFIIIRSANLKEDSVFINHEKIHLRQQLELLILPFFIWYGAEFVVRYVRCRNWSLAYKSISFEQEAYGNETNFDYLKVRTLWGFWKYV